MAKKINKKRKATQYERKKIPADEKAVICYCPKVCPDVMRVRMRQSEFRSLSGAGAVSFNAYIYRGNSIFDPNFTGVGHQPLGHDQWQAFYRRYRVIGSRVDIKFLASSAAAENLVGMLVPLNTSTVLSNAEDYMEAAYSKNCNIGQSTSNGVGELSMYMAVNKIRGGPHNLVRYEEDYGALFGANPSKEFFWHIVVRAVDGSLTWTCDYAVDVTYYVEMFDRQSLDQS